MADRFIENLAKPFLKEGWTSKERSAGFEKGKTFLKRDKVLPII
jgi:hypothetical protein